MKTKFILFGFALVLSGVGFGCSTTHSLDAANANTCTPSGKLVLSGRTLYGTTASDSAAWGAGGGAVFKVDTDGTGFAVLHHFLSVAYPHPTNSDGSVPMAGVVLMDDTLYGTTVQGGAAGDGTVFKIKTDGSDFAVLHTFTGPDGIRPLAGLTVSGHTLYGITQRGGHNEGVIFKMNTDGTGFATLHVFSKLVPQIYVTTNPATGSVWSAPSHYTNCDGAFSQSELALLDHTLYGTGWGGGPGGSGTIFKVNTDGSDFEVLHAFEEERVDRSSRHWNGTNADGATLETGLFVNGDALYGITSEGGVNGKGTAFKIDPDGTGFTILRSFIAVTPNNLIRLGDAFYGITPEGTFTKFDPAGTSLSLPSYSGGAVSLISSHGMFYGATSYGGPKGGGTVFKVNLDGTGYTVLHGFLEVPPPPGMTD